MRRRGRCRGARQKKSDTDTGRAVKNETRPFFSPAVAFIDGILPNDAHPMPDLIGNDVRSLLIDALNLL